MIYTTRSHDTIRTQNQKEIDPNQNTHLADKMRPTFIYTALLLSFVVSTNAEIIDSSILKPFAECKSTLQIQIQGEGLSISEATARINCVNSCSVGATEFMNKRCPELCGLPGIARGGGGFSASVCTLCSDGAVSETQRCKDAVDSGVQRCAQGCLTNPPQGNTLFSKISSTSGGIYLDFPSKVSPLR